MPLERTAPIRPIIIPPSPQRPPAQPAQGEQIRQQAGRAANTTLEGSRSFRLGVYHTLRLAGTAVLLGTLGAQVSMDPHFPAAALSALGNTPITMWHSPDFMSGLSILGQSLRTNTLSILRGAKDIVATNPQADGLTLASSGLYLYDYARQKREQLRRFARRGR